MVKPLSKRRRVSILIIFVLFFFAFLPVVVLYSSGYRLGEKWEIVKTGAIYLEVPYDGASVYVDGKLIGETGFFKSSFFIQDLIPKKYLLKVTKSDYTEWSKNFYVKEQVVSKGWPISIPNNIKMTEVQQYPVVASSSASSSVVSTVVKKTSKSASSLAGASSTKDFTKEYVLALDLFATTTSALDYKDNRNATSSMKDAKYDSKIIIYSEDNGSIYAIWNGNINLAPDIMCQKDSCPLKNRIVKTKGLKYFNFFPGRNDVIIYSDSTGVYVKDVDIKSPDNKFTVSTSTTADFRLGTYGEVYLKDGDKIYNLDFAQN